MIDGSVSAAIGVLPRPNERRLAVRLTNDALRQVRGGHPWVYRQSITSITPGGLSGDLAVVFDQRRSFAAIGLYDADSPIALKILHTGNPVPIEVDWWRHRFGEAAARRSAFIADLDPRLGAYRMLNGENDGFPGLIVDRYADVLVVKLYSTIWFPHLRAMLDLLIDSGGVRAVVLRLARSVQRGGTFGLVDGDVIAGELADGPVNFVENDLRFAADVRRGQKTGWFLDQRTNRARVAALASGRRVLDVFSAAGGFSVHAAAGGARSVVSVDASAPTLAAALENMALNVDRSAVVECEHQTIRGDAFDVMRRLGDEPQRFDVVVVDPPSFTPRQDHVAAALASYGRLTSLAVRLIEPGGTLIQASCSSRVTPDDFYATVNHAGRTAGRSLVEIERTGHDVDHPIGFAQGGYLKAGFWRVE